MRSGEALSADAADLQRIQNMGAFDFLKNKPSGDVPIPSPEPGQHMVVFHGLGMHWAGCQASVEAELQAVPGAHHVNVDLKQQSASVIFDPATADVHLLREAVEQAGFTPTSEAVTEG
jgi:copper chaperone CopZ